MLSHDWMPLQSSHAVWVEGDDKGNCPRPMDRWAIEDSSGSSYSVCGEIAPGKVLPWSQILTRCDVMTAKRVGPQVRQVSRDVNQRDSSTFQRYSRWLVVYALPVLAHMALESIE